MTAATMSGTKLEGRFRARALDHNRDLEIWLRCDLHVRTDYHGQASRAVPAMPTGVDKDEEQELHLKLALEAQRNKQDGNSQRCDDIPTEPTQNGPLVNGFSDKSQKAIPPIKISQGRLIKTEVETKVVVKEEACESNATKENDDQHIPVPDTYVLDDVVRSQDDEFKHGKHYYKHNQLNSMIQESPPVYCYDSDDEEFLTTSLNIPTPISEKFAELFERLTDVFDDAAPLTNQTLTFQEAVHAINNDPSLQKLRKLAISKSSASSSSSKEAAFNTQLLTHFDTSNVRKYLEYYNKKRNKSSGSSIGRTMAPKLHHDKGDPGVKDAYICFRRRSDKRVQTRRNRRNDENNFEKFVRLKHECTMVKELFTQMHLREKWKKEFLAASISVFKARREAQDFNGQRSRSCTKQLEHQSRGSTLDAKKIFSKRPEKERSSSSNSNASVSLPDLTDQAALEATATEMLARAVQLEKQAVEKQDQISQFQLTDSIATLLNTFSKNNKKLGAQISEAHVAMKMQLEKEDQEKREADALKQVMQLSLSHGFTASRSYLQGFDMAKIQSRYSQSLVERRTERHYRRQLKRKNKEKQKSTPGCMPSTSLSVDQLPVLNTTNSGPSPISKLVHPRMDPSSSYPPHIQPIPIQHVGNMKLISPNGMAEQQPSQPPMPDVSEITKVNRRGELLTKLHRQISNLSKSQPPHNHIYARWYWSRYPTVETTIASGATQSNFNLQGNLLYSRGGTTSPTTMAGIQKNAAEGKVSHNPQEGEFSWDSPAVTRVEPPDRLKAKLSRFCFRRKRNSSYISIRQPPVGTGWRDDLDLSDIPLSCSLKSSSPAPIAQLHQSPQPSPGRDRHRSRDCVTPCLGLIELSNELDLGLKRVRMTTISSGLEVKPTPSADVDQEVEALRQRSLALTTRLPSAASSISSSVVDELKTHNKDLKFWWKHQNQQRSSDSSLGVKRLKMTDRNFVTPRSLLDCAYMAITSKTNIDRASSFSSPLTIQTSLSAGVPGDPGSLLRIGTAGQPVTPRIRQPRRASLAASQKWSSLNRPKVHAPHSPASSSTNSRHSFHRNGMQEMGRPSATSPASLQSTGTVSTDGTDLVRSQAFITCPSDGSVTSGFDSNPIDPNLQFQKSEISLARFVADGGAGGHSSAANTRKTDS